MSANSILSTLNNNGVDAPVPFTFLRCNATFLMPLPQADLPTPNFDGMKVPYNQNISKMEENTLSAAELRSIRSNYGSNRKLRMEYLNNPYLN